MSFTDKINSITIINYKYFGLVEFIFFILILLIFYRWKLFNISVKYPSTTILITLLLLTTLINAFFFVKNRESIKKYEKISLDIDLSTFFKKFFLTIGFILLTICVAIVLFYLINKFSWLRNITHIIIIALILGGIGGSIYISYRSTIDKLKNNKNIYINLLTNIIFYIPCLLVYFIDKVKYEFDITSPTVWIIFAIEIFLILLYLILPALFKKVINSSRTQLIKDPVNINTERTLGDFDILHKGKGKHNYNYALSFWYYINPQPTSTNASYTKYTPIFSYGNKPVVEYNGLKNILRVSTENNPAQRFTEIYKDTDIKYQKWNFMVINYDGANMDIFINGNLVGTHPNIVPYMKYENITIGSRNGIQGGICNVNYYDNTISKNSIEIEYKMLRDRVIPLL